MSHPSIPRSNTIGLSESWLTGLENEALNSALSSQNVLDVTNSAINRILEHNATLQKFTRESRQKVDSVIKASLSRNDPPMPRPSSKRVHLQPIFDMKDSITLGERGRIIGEMSNGLRSAVREEAKKEVRASMLQMLDDSTKFQKEIDRALKFSSTATSEERSRLIKMKDKEVERSNQELLLHFARYKGTRTLRSFPIEESFAFDLPSSQPSSRPPSTHRSITTPIRRSRPTSSRIRTPFSAVQSRPSSSRTSLSTRKGTSRPSSSRTSLSTRKGTSRPSSSRTSLSTRKGTSRPSSSRTSLSTRKGTSRPSSSRNINNGILHQSNAIYHLKGDHDDFLGTLREAGEQDNVIQKIDETQNQNIDEIRQMKPPGTNPSVKNKVVVKSLIVNPAAIQKFEKGDEVEASIIINNTIGWYLAKIKGVNKDGSYVLHWFGGEREANVDSSRIRQYVPSIFGAHNGNQTLPSPMKPLGRGKHSASGTVAKARKRAAELRRNISATGEVALGNIKRSPTSDDDAKFIDETHLDGKNNLTFMILAHRHGGSGNGEPDFEMDDVQHELLCIQNKKGNSQIEKETTKYREKNTKGRSLMNKETTKNREKKKRLSALEHLAMNHQKQNKQKSMALNIASSREFIWANFTLQEQGFHSAVAILWHAYLQAGQSGSMAALGAIMRYEKTNLKPTDEPTDVGKCLRKLEYYQKLEDTRQKESTIHLDDCCVHLEEVPVSLSYSDNGSLADLVKSNTMPIDMSFAGLRPVHWDMNYMRPTAYPTGRSIQAHEDFARRSKINPTTYRGPENQPRCKSKFRPSQCQWVKQNDTLHGKKPFWVHSTTNEIRWKKPPTRYIKQ